MNGNTAPFPFNYLLRALSVPYRYYRWLMLVRPIRFTRFGTFYILFALATGAAAINTGNNLLYLILGIMLGLIVVSGFLSDSCLWGLDTSWSSVGNLYAGQKAAFVCRMKKGWFPAMEVTVRAEWNRAAALSYLIYWLSPRTEDQFQFHLTPLRRGWLTLKRLRYSTRFPFGLFEKFHEESRDERWLVYPHVEHLDLNQTLSLEESGSFRPAARVGAGVVPFLLRDFRQGDSARRIHWKSSARRQRLLVNDMEDESQRGDILWVPQWPKQRPPDEQERFISFIASVAFTLYERNRPVGLVTPEAAFAAEHSRAHINSLLRYLALVDLSSSASTLRSAPAVRNGIDLRKAWERRAA